MKKKVTQGWQYCYGLGGKAIFRPTDLQNGRTNQKVSSKAAYLTTNMQFYFAQKDMCRLHTPKHQWLCYYRDIQLKKRSLGLMVTKRPSKVWLCSLGIFRKKRLLRLWKFSESWPYRIRISLIRSSPFLHSCWPLNPSPTSLTISCNSCNHLPIRQFLSRWRRNSSSALCDRICRLLSCNSYSHLPICKLLSQSRRNFSVSHFHPSLAGFSQWVWRVHRPCLW